ncbi:MAG: asparagine--tRNA ligase [Bacteroidetes bacterium]|nr:asparagine--tRNA ligase [Bacteroidota bacterium]MBU1114547.1 asparagine--tRNA ligase [Bacteroidota bacterium]MBU1798616.1 asparagine--tRNA ligase [Bacteroidota bacterium]
MKPKIYIKDLSEHEGKEVTLKGWLYNKRESGKKLKFLILRDGTGYLQCIVFTGNVTEEVFEVAAQLHQEAAFEVTGMVKAEPRAVGGYELDATDVKLIGASEDYPITPKDHGVEFLIDNRHLWLRSKRQVAIMKIRHRIVKSIRDFFDERDFTLFDPPIITPNASEGTSTLFEMEYFDLGKAYLTQSGQLYAEAGALALGKVYTFGPTFRAEKSKTRRHLTEFWMVEPEMAFYNLDDDMDLAEEFLEYIVKSVLKNNKEDLEILERDITKLEKIERPFPRLSYSDAVQMLKDEGHEFQWGDDLGAADETIISSKYDKPVMVHRYPAAIKAFYMKRDPENEKLALAVDVLAPEGYGEIIGGSQREDDYDLLLGRIEEHKLPVDFFKWYLDLRKYGSVPHSGFGLGLERTITWICGIDHLRETIPFPRMIYRNTP